MPTIMCTRALWRQLGGRGVLPHRRAPGEEETRLGAWAAKHMASPEGLFCVGLNEATYLTIVFPLAPLPPFLAAFTLAAALELQHIGVADRIIAAELEPFVDQVFLARNSNRSLLGSLNDVCFHLAWALEDAGRSDPSTVLRIQHDLNEMPHANRGIPVPAEATALLLSGETIV